MIVGRQLPIGTSGMDDRVALCSLFVSVLLCVVGAQQYCTTVLCLSALHCGKATFCMVGFMALILLGDCTYLKGAI